MSSVNATNAWNSVCGQYHFIPKPANSNITFTQGYFGNNFALEMSLITNRVNAITLGVESPSGGNDVMKFRIENWAGPVGGGL